MVRTVQTQVAVRQRSDDEQRRIILDHMGHEMTRIKYLEDLEDFLAQEADAALLRHLDSMARDGRNPGEIVERLERGYAENREALTQTLNNLFHQLLGEQNLDDVAHKLRSLQETTSRITKRRAHNGEKKPNAAQRDRC
jgi:hypothetical protein